MIWLEAMWEDKYITVSGSWKEWHHAGYPGKRLVADVSWKYSNIRKVNRDSRKVAKSFAEKNGSRVLRQHRTRKYIDLCYDTDCLFFKNLDAFVGPSLFYGPLTGKDESRRELADFYQKVQKVILAGDVDYPWGLKHVVRYLQGLKELTIMVPNVAKRASGGRASYELRTNSALGLEWNKRLPTLPPIVKYMTSGEVQSIVSGR